MAMVMKSEICSHREIFGQAHACCTFSPSPSPGPCPRSEESAFSTYPSFLCFLLHLSPLWAETFAT